MTRVCLYYRTEPDKDRWFRGDRHIRPVIRSLVRGKARPGGLDKVFQNLCLGLALLKIPYEVNLPFGSLRAGDRVGVLGRGRYSLEGYDRGNPIVAGIGLMTHPSEWPTLCSDYPVSRYLQHSEWANNVYKPYFGKRCGVWPVGVDTEKWTPSFEGKDVDVLLYDKVTWDRAIYEATLIRPIRQALRERGLKVKEIRYGAYREEEYRHLVARSKAMVFLSAHESQGLAYQECLSSDVPILAWDQGWCLDPSRIRWGSAEIPASSVPYFDGRCGETFREIGQFERKLELFLERQRRREFQPRSYVVERLTLTRSAQAFLDFFPA